MRYHHAMSARAKSRIARGEAVRTGGAGIGPTTRPSAASGGEEGR